MTLDTPWNIVSTTHRIIKNRIVEFTVDGNFNKFLLKSNWPEIKVIEKDAEGNKLMCSG